MHLFVGINSGCRRRTPRWVWVRLHRCDTRRLPGHDCDHRARSGSRGNHRACGGSFRSRGAQSQSHRHGKRTSFARSILSDDTGHYTVPSLRPTDYTLTIEATGFDRFVQHNIRLVADQTATIDVQLKIGSTAETMTVSATAASAPLVDAATPTLTEVVGTTRIAELPLNGRAVAL